MALRAKSEFSRVCEEFSNSAGLFAFKSEVGEDCCNALQPIRVQLDAQDVVSHPSDQNRVVLEDRWICAESIPGDLVFHFPFPAFFLQDLHGWFMAGDDHLFRLQTIHDGYIWYGEAATEYLFIGRSTPLPINSYNFHRFADDVDLVIFIHCHTTITKIPTQLVELHVHVSPYLWE